VSRRHARRGRLVRPLSPQRRLSFPLFAAAPCRFASPVLLPLRRHRRRRSLARGRASPHSTPVPSTRLLSQRAVCENSFVRPVPNGCLSSSSPASVRGFLSGSFRFRTPLESFIACAISRPWATVSCNAYSFKPSLCSRSIFASARRHRSNPLASSAAVSNGDDGGGGAGTGEEELDSVGKGKKGLERRKKRASVKKMSWNFQGMEERLPVKFESSQSFSLSYKFRRSAEGAKHAPFATGWMRNSRRFSPLCSKIYRRSQANTVYVHFHFASPPLQVRFCICASRRRRRLGSVLPRIRSFVELEEQREGEERRILVDGIRVRLAAADALH